MNKRISYLTKAAVIAAIYVVLTFVSAIFGLSNGVIQVRISEALTVLPYFLPEATAGLFIGCIIANTLTGCALWDVIFGSIATLIGAWCTSKLKNRWLLPLPPVISNAIIVPFVLQYVYGATESWLFITATVAAGEIISCGILGQILYSLIDKNKIFKR
ncbi:MAG: QueT transporter family protein [Clostridia bacterium]|nr:QueT transporter family protein [Clostridia bacterium]